MKSTRKKQTHQHNKTGVPVTVGRYTYNVIITPNDPDGYLVTCPALPGLVTQGDTLEEAREMAADALACHLESMIEDGETPPEDLTIITPVSVRVA